MAEDRVQRRLAAILAADVVGYSRLMGEDEAGTLATAEWAERALRDQPNFAPLRRIAAASHALRGCPSEAQKIMAQLRQLDPALRLSDLGDIMPPFRRPADRSKYLEGLRKAGLPE
jgi:hypothetical protein